MILKVLSPDQQQEQHLRNLVEMQILWPHPRSTEFETGGGTWSYLWLIDPSRIHSDARSHWRTTALDLGYFHD